MPIKLLLGKEKIEHYLRELGGSLGYNIFLFVHLFTIHLNFRHRASSI